MSPEMTYKLREDSQSDPVRTAALNKLKRDTKSDYKPTPLVTVDIGYGGVGQGHAEVTRDGEVAYQSALLHWATDSVEYAKIGLSILDGWSKTNKEFKGDNAPLEAAWSICSMARCAELLKYSRNKDVKDGWLRIQSQFFVWLDRVILPVLRTKSIWNWKVIGNWHYSIMCARMQIAILREDANEFNWALLAYRESLPKTICIGHPCHTCETKRDVTHASFLLGGLIQLPEMAYHQGIKDVYDARLHPIMEYQAKIMLKQIPEGISKGEIRTPYGYWNEPVWEIGLAHFQDRLKMNMHFTQENLKSFRPERVTFHWGAGTLTHYRRCK